MAVSDIFGTNLFNVGMLFFVDMLYRGGPVLNEAGRSPPSPRCWAWRYRRCS